MNVSLPKDADGRTVRACPSNACSPGYFKVKTGTKITGDHKLAYCPYCGRAAEPSDFLTKSQMKYAKDVMAREAHPGILRMLKDALDVGPSGKKSFAFIGSTKAGKRAEVGESFFTGSVGVLASPES
jgi:hypothetical protein